MTMVIIRNTCTLMTSVSQPFQIMNNLCFTEEYWWYHFWTYNWNKVLMPPNVSIHTVSKNHLWGYKLSILFSLIRSPLKIKKYQGIHHFIKSLYQLFCRSLATHCTSISMVSAKLETTAEYCWELEVSIHNNTPLHSLQLLPDCSSAHSDNSDAGSAALHCTLSNHWMRTLHCFH